MSGLNEEGRFVFNQNYLLKYDKKRFELMVRGLHEIFSHPNNDVEIDDIHLTFHPLLALFMLLFDGYRSTAEVVSEYCRLTGFNKDNINKFVKYMLTELAIENKGKYLKFGEDVFYFPKNILLKNRGEKLNISININDFLIPQSELDLRSYRSYIPTDCHFELNFNCMTDCIYCYADRRNQKECTMSMERITEIIKEARVLGMRSIDLSGGELFLHENWELILEELLSNGFHPYISTKIPISTSIIKKLKSLGIEGIQISLDSVNQDELKQILGVNNSYKNKILNTLKSLNQEGFKIAVNSQITKYNDNLNHIQELLDFLVSLKNIKTIRMGVAAYSIYKPPENYLNMSPELSKVRRIEELLNTYKEKHENISISFTGYATEEASIGKEARRSEDFSKRARCSGNFYGFVILPDGKVTICEELYYHPRFLIGDLNSQSIEEIWNSPRALELYEISQEMIQKKSACKDCGQFDLCHRKKGVCWKNVLIAYGYDNWDYPDPRCPKAPDPFYLHWIK